MSDPVDWWWLRSLAREVDDDAMVAAAVTAYLSELPTRLRALTTAASDGTSAQLRAAAHELKGASAAVGAVPLARLCRAVEVATAQGDPTRAHELAGAAVAEAGRVAAALRTGPPA